MADSTDKTAAARKLMPQTVSKTQARRNFFSLVDSLSSANAAVQITDHGEPVAVLLNYQNYVALTAEVYPNAAHVKPQPNLIGSIVINSDLVTASKKLAGRFKVSLDESTSELRED
jgi:PHD/YefM family antitoxin component YafN of YafNO toxin-antitoxin module